MVPPPWSLFLCKFLKVNTFGLDLGVSWSEKSYKMEFVGRKIFTNGWLMVFGSGWIAKTAVRAGHLGAVVFASRVDT